MARKFKSIWVLAPMTVLDVRYTHRVSLTEAPVRERVQNYIHIEHHKKNAALVYPFDVVGDPRNGQRDG